MELAEQTDIHSKGTKYRTLHTHGTTPPVRSAETGAAAMWCVNQGGSLGARGAAAEEARERGAGVPQPSVSEGVAQMGQLYRDSVALGSEHVSQMFFKLQGRAGKSISYKRQSVLSEAQLRSSATHADQRADSAGPGGLAAWDACGRAAGDRGFQLHMGAREGLSMEMSPVWEWGDDE